MDEILRRRIEARLGLIGSNWAEMSTVIDVSAPTLSRYASTNYNKLPQWLQEHIAHYLGLDRLDELVDEGHEEFLMGAHPFFGPVATLPLPKKRMQKAWFKRTYTGLRKGESPPKDTA